MDPGTIIGLLLGIIAVFAALFMEGGNPAAFLIPSPIVLVIFGTLGVCMASTGLKATLRIPKLWIKAMTGTPPDRPEAIKTLVRMAERARREGLLALEEEAQGVDDPFLSKGLRLVVDGTDPELVKDILDLDVESMAGRHHENAALFTHASGFAPTIGIIGTVMGLVHVLENLSNPAALGPVHRRRLHRHLPRGRLREPLLPARGEQAEGAVDPRGGRADDDDRGHPLDPGR